MSNSSKVVPSTTKVGPVQKDTRTADSGKIVLGGGFRLPVRTGDNGNGCLGDTFRRPIESA